MNSMLAIDLAEDQTMAMLKAATSKAEQLGVSVSVAVVDRGGATCGLIRMARAHLGSVDTAVDKAWSCISFGGLSTRAMSDWVATHPPHEMAVLLSRPRFTPLPGGLAIRKAGLHIGAVGVAGASAEQDEECGRAALASIDAERT